MRYPQMDCQWDGCDEKVEENSKLHFNKHIEKQTDYMCLWAGCSRYRELQSTKYALQAHVRRHSGERPFKCKLCNKDFTRSDALNKHIKRHELAEKQNEEMVSRISYLSSKITELEKTARMLIIERERHKESIRIIDEDILEAIKNCINQNMPVTKEKLWNEYL